MQVIATTRSPPHASAIEEVVALLTQLGNRESDQDDEGTSTGRKRLRREVASDSKDHVYNVIVAVRQENILATAFHPELTDDLRWHRYRFISILLHYGNDCIQMCMYIGSSWILWLMPKIESHKVIKETFFLECSYLTAEQKILYGTINFNIH